MFLLPDTGMGGGGLLELSPGDAPFTATLELNAPAPAAVTATAGLFAMDRSEDAEPLATAIVVIGADGTQARVIFEGFDPTASDAEWYTAAVIAAEGPAALDVEDTQIGFNAEGVAQTDDHDGDDPTGASNDDGTHNDGAR
jgi:hypothetical protein